MGSNSPRSEEKVAAIAVRIFGKRECDICKTATENINRYLSEIRHKIETFHYDMDTLDGLTEAAVHSAFDVPTIIIEKDRKEIRRWKSLPPAEEFINVCSCL